MATTQISTWKRSLRVLRTDALPGGSLTASSRLGIAPCKGWGTMRVVIFADVAVTLLFFQKPRDTTDDDFAMRQTDTQSIAASTSTSVEFLITGDYCDIRLTTTTAPATFELEATLVP